MATLKTSRPSAPNGVLAQKILVLSNTLATAATRMYGRKFDLPLAEWRLLAMVAQSESAGVVELAQMLATHKAWVSRTARSLESKGLIKACADNSDARRTLFALTLKGQKLYQQIVPVTMERNARLLSALTKDETIVFDHLLDKLQIRAAEMLAEQQ